MTEGNGSTDTDAPNAAPEKSSTRHEWGQGEQPSTAVVEAVATATGRDSTDLAPLHDHVDADALDALVDPGPDGAGNGIRVSFAYDGVEVVVDREEGIEVLNLPGEDR